MIVPGQSGWVQSITRETAVGPTAGAGDAGGAAASAATNTGALPGLPQTAQHSSMIMPGQSGWVQSITRETAVGPTARAGLLWAGLPAEVGWPFAGLCLI